MNVHHKRGSLTPEQQVTDTNPLFDLATAPPDLYTLSPHSSAQHDADDTHTPHGKSSFICALIIFALLEF
jgi:hypothetical protein